MFEYWSFYCTKTFEGNGRWIPQELFQRVAFLSGLRSAFHCHLSSKETFSVAYCYHGGEIGLLWKLFEKWKRSWVGKATPLIPKVSIHSKKGLLWEFFILYCELLEPGETVRAECYSDQSGKWSEKKINELQSSCSHSQKKIIFLYNTRPHIAKARKDTTLCLV